MISFKEYTQLSESTKDLHKAIGEEETNDLLDRPVVKSVQAMHDKVFGEGNHHIEIPLKNEVPSVVKDHVKSNGDHLDGDKVKLKSGRSVEISKYLGKSKAPTHIVNAHDHWHKNKGSDGNTKLVITRHRGEVASCSTGTHWDSCAKAVKEGDVPGPAWEAMRHEVKHGTLMAMHVHADAKPNEHGEYDSKNILGRTLIKRHHSADEKRSSFHQEQRHYGAFPEEAEKAVDKFTKKHYPMHHEDAVHTKHEDLYDDDGHPTKYNHDISDENLHKAIKQPSTLGRFNALGHPSLAGSHIHAALDDEVPAIRKMAALHRNATSDNIHKALKDTHESVRVAAMNNLNTKEEHISKGLKDSSVLVRKRAIQHPNATPKNIHDALDDPSPIVRTEAAAHKNASHENITKAINDKSDEVSLVALHNRNASKEHLQHTLQNHPNEHLRRHAQAILSAKAKLYPEAN